MWDKGVDACLLILKFVTDWFVTNKVPTKLDDLVLSNGESTDKDFDNNTFVSDNMDLNTVDLIPIQVGGKMAPVSFSL